MKVLEPLIVGALVGLLFALVAEKVSADTRLLVGVHTTHWGSDRSYNEQNEFIGLSVGHLDVATWYNSHYRRSWAVGLNATRTVNRWDLVGRVGVATGYNFGVCEGPVTRHLQRRVCLYVAGSAFYKLDEHLAVGPTFASNAILTGVRLSW